MYQPVGLAGSNGKPWPLAAHRPFEEQNALTGP
jgi:hypothetical protein